MITHRIVAISLALLLAGCNRSKTVSTPGGDVKVEESGKAGQSTVTFTGKNGESMTINSEGSKLPDDYPKDVPVASGAKIVMATSVNNADNKGSSLVLESADSFDKTVAFYKKGLADQGWKIDATIAAENMTMFTAAKDTRQLAIQIGQSDGKCSVTQTLGVKK
jgi:hypothetical protein